MKTLKIFALAALTVLAGATLGSCSDACDYLDTNTDNPSWVPNYNDTVPVPHPEKIEGTKWVRESGLKKNAFGEDVQGFVESINFVTKDSCEVKMSEPTFPAHFNSQNITWLDESNTERLPQYYYEYSKVTGSVSIKKSEKDDKNKVIIKEIFVGVAVSGSREVMTIAHFGDTPVQSYLVKK